MTKEKWPRVSAVGGVLFSLLILSGCSLGISTSTTPAEPLTSEEYALDETSYQLPDKRFVNCLEYGLGLKSGSFTCLLTEQVPDNFTQANEVFDVVHLVNSSKENLVCLDYGIGAKYGAISCVPGVPR